MKLLKERRDYADEFDTYGFLVMTDSEYQAWLNYVNGGNYPVEVYFGTNQCHEIESVEDYLNDIKVVDISDEEAATILNLFGTHYGSFTELEFHDEED